MPITGHELKAGQVWRYHAPEGFEQSRLVIGAIATFADQRRIVCVSVNEAPQRHPDGSIAAMNIAFLPLSEDAFAATVVALDDEASVGVNTEFADGFTEWNDDERGLTCFTVAFDGWLDRLIARQMAAIVGSDAA